jgi:hypothetical protein
MFGRRGLLLLLLAGTIAVPYAASNSSDLREKAAKVVPALAADDDGEADGDADASSTPAATVAAKDGAPSSNATPNGAAPAATAQRASDLTDVAEMAEVFRLDVTPVWVMNRWTRVSTQLAGLNEHGYRVPLVTGSREDDLAGALTYYFTAEHRLRRITFSGTTGDPKRLIGMLNSQFQFERKITADAGSFTYASKDSSSVPSTLQIRPVRVVRANAPHARYNIELEMNAGA